MKAFSKLVTPMVCVCVCVRGGVDLSQATKRALPPTRPLVINLNIINYIKSLFIF